MRVLLESNVCPECGYIEDICWSYFPPSAFCVNCQALACLEWKLPIFTIFDKELQ